MVASMHRFVQNIWISYRALFRWFNPTSYLASKVLAPLEQILFFTLLGRYAGGPDQVAFYAIGNAVLVVGFSGIYGVTISVSQERSEGTLPHLMGSPASRGFIFLGRGIGHVVDALLTVVLALFFALALFQIDFSHAHVPTLALAILTAAVSTTSLGLLLGSLSLVVRDWYLVMNFTYLLLLVLAGINIPLDRLPVWLGWISPLLPLTRSVGVARRALTGETFIHSWYPLLVEVALGLLYLAAGFAMMVWSERKARQHGTLEVL